MRLPTVVHETIRNPIPNNFIKHYIFGETKKSQGKQASSSRAPPSQFEPQPHFSHFDPHTMLLLILQTTPNGNTSAILIHETCWRQLTVLTHIFSSLSIWCGSRQGTPEVMSQFMTPEAYQTYVSWPEGRPDAYGGVDHRLGRFLITYWWKTLTETINKNTYFWYYIKMAPLPGTGV